MEGMIIAVWTVGLFSVQLFLCAKGKKLAVKLVPVFIQVAAVLACALGYGLSGWKNWAFLILFVLMLIPLAAVGFAWLIYGTFKFVKKAGK